MIHTLTSAEHRNPSAPGCFLERPVRGIPDSTPRAPSVVSGARSTCIVRAALTCVRSIPSKAPTHVPVRPASSTSRLSTLETDSFGLVTPPRRPLAESPEALLLRFVLSRARTRGVPRYFQPTSATQSCSSLYLSAPALSSPEKAARLAPNLFEKPAGSRRRICWGGTGRSGARYSLAEVVSDLRRLTPQSAVPLRALRPLSRTCTGLNHFGHFYERAVTLTFASLTKRRLTLESIRAPASLRKGQARVPFGTLAQPVSNHGYVGGTPPR